MTIMDTPDGNGLTPLHYATLARERAAVAWLRAARGEAASAAQAAGRGHGLKNFRV